MLKWAQRKGKVFITCEDSRDTGRVDIFEDRFVITWGIDETFSREVKVQRTIDVNSSKWFTNDRCTSIVLAKKEEEFWNFLMSSDDKNCNIKTDFTKFCDHDDPEYAGEIISGIPQMEDFLT